MVKEVKLTNWVTIQLDDHSIIYGEEPISKNIFITSQIEASDTASPPKWVITKSGTKYTLLTRASMISEIAYKAIYDTLTKKGINNNDVIIYLAKASQSIFKNIPVCNRESVNDSITIHIS